MIISVQGGGLSGMNKEEEKNIYSLWKINLRLFLNTTKHIPTKSTAH